MKACDRSPEEMKTLLLFRAALVLIMFGLTACAGSSRSGVAVGTSGPLTAFRVGAPLGWAIQIRNDSDTERKALYAINDLPGLKVVPAHRTITAGYVLGAEIPSFNFAPEY
ncbi:MAG TPA: hypothetical protein VE242_03770 [Chthoniobacterales bacterium]|nr:hypothetical protein [Chthoniobacterales bacterium]